MLVRTGATIGICSVSTAGTWLLSLGPQLLATVSVVPGWSTLGTEFTTRNSIIGPITGSSGRPASASASDSAPCGPRPSSRILSRLTSLMPGADREDREVDDDVVALGDALLVERGERDRVDHQVAVVGDELERHRRPVVGQRQLVVARHRGVEDAEAVLPRQHLEVGGIGEVDERQVAQEAVGGEDVEEVLAVRIGGAVGDDQVDVEIDIAEAEPGAARQPQVAARR